MAVYVDLLRSCLPWGRGRWTKSSHLFTSPGNLDELHEFARSIGLKRVWFQDKPSLPHYDLHTNAREKALRAGAVEVGSLFLVETIRAWRESNAQTKEEREKGT